MEYNKSVCDMKVGDEVEGFYILKAVSYTHLGGHKMIKLIVGIKGTGKTKQLIDMANAAVTATKGCVICAEKGNKLIHEIKYQARLVDVDEYAIDDARSLYGFVSGMFASNHDVTDLFIDSALKICNNDINEFIRCV